MDFAKIVLNSIFSISSRIIIIFVFIISYSTEPTIILLDRFDPNCNVKGLKQGTNVELMKNLCLLSQEFGAIRVTGSCRTEKANLSVKNSYHLYHRGCKAADIVIEGANKQKILNWWAENVGGGRGYYCGKRFVHVDVGENRSWRWYCD